MSVTPTLAGSSKTFIVTGSAKTGTSTFNVNPGVQTKLVITLPGETFTAGLGNSGTVTAQTAGTSFNIVSITATDAYFNIVTSYSGAKTIAYSGPGSGLNAPSYTTAVSFTNGQSTTILSTTLTKAETTTLTAKDGGLYGNASSSLTVNPGALDHFAISTISSPQTAGTAITGITLTAQDANNNTATNFTAQVTYSGTAGITGTSAAVHFRPVDGRERDADGGGQRPDVHRHRVRQDGHQHLRCQSGRAGSLRDLGDFLAADGGHGHHGHHADGARREQQHGDKFQRGSTVSYSGTAGSRARPQRSLPGVLSGVSVTPTVAGSSLTFIVTGVRPRPAPAPLTSIRARWIILRSQPFPRRRRRARPSRASR